MTAEFLHHLAVLMLAGAAFLELLANLVRCPAWAELSGTGRAALRGRARWAPCPRWRQVTSGVAPRHRGRPVPRLAVHGSALVRTDGEARALPGVRSGARGSRNGP